MAELYVDSRYSTSVLTKQPDSLCSLGKYKGHFKGMEMEMETVYHKDLSMEFHWAKQVFSSIELLYKPYCSSREILKTLTREVGSLLAGDYCCVVEFPDGERAKVQAEYHGLQGAAHKKSSPAVLNLLPPQLWEQHVVSANINSDLTLELDERWRDFFRKKHAKGIMTVPLVSEHQLFGLLIVCTKQPRVWHHYEISYIKDLARHAGHAIEQSKLQEKLERSSHLKSSFLAKITHELRTPLTSILGYSEMLESGYGGDLTEKQKKYIHNILASSHHLLDMVNDILDLSKVEAGKLDLKITGFELLALVEEVKDMVVEMAHARRISLDIDIHPEVGTIYADPSRFRQILLNLVSNGVKYNRDGGKVRISFKLTEDQQWVCGEVSDNGIGIPADKMRYLFTEYYQVLDQQSGQSNGTGLGLALTRYLLELHGGNIMVKSEVGVGTVFTFHLPVHPMKPLTH